MIVLTRHMFDPVEPPRQRAPERDIPAEAEAIVMRALAKERDDRWPSMVALADAIAASLPGQPSARAWLEGSRDSPGPAAVVPAAAPEAAGERELAREVEPVAAQAHEHPAAHDGATGRDRVVAREPRQQRVHPSHEYKHPGSGRDRGGVRTCHALAPELGDGRVIGETGLPEEANGEADQLYDMAVRIVTETRRCSTSWIQRKLGVGYNRAAKIVECMEKRGLVGPANGAKDREVLIAPL